MFFYSITISLGLLLAACDPKPVTPPDNKPGEGQDPNSVAQVATFITTADNTMHFSSVKKNFSVLAFHSIILLMIMMRFRVIRLLVIVQFINHFVRLLHVFLVNSTSILLML